ncbi:uncharacterized protein UTRI_01655_B [Ustilago trichophora]|uniref:Uncharacterized protein n=1 Tax=Ustilago trichophora TaxID=86804 RepID=A0A5C3E5K6_9BASI|nr:uncharacterized protein UTRI_01655_B [Ustilago trichophora]
MSAIASRPTSMANSFYESEGRPSIEPARTNKTRELARAIGRERDGLVPSFRPPSNWSQRSSHHDVVWSGDDGHLRDANDDQFSDAESWDADTQASSHAATNGEHDATTSVYGHVRPTSIGSSIFAGRGAKSERRRREAPPPLPTLPATHQNNLFLGSDGVGLLSPSAQSMLSPRSDASGFESSSQYSANDGQDDRANDDLASGFDLQNGSHQSRSRQQSSNETAEFDTQSTVPSRNSSRVPPPLPIKAASRSSHESSPPRNASTSPSTANAASRISPARLPDGTLIPKMPPVPQTTDLSRPRKAKTRRDRSPVLSFDGGAEEEEKMLVELQDKLANDARRISTLGPKVKKNAPAPWELGGEDIATSAGRPSLREQLRPSAETFEKPFSRFKSRPSVESSHAGARSPNPAHISSGLAHSSFASNAPSLEQEAQKEDDVHSIFATQRSRSKSVSNTAVGMLKGLGLAGAAVPASKKGKLTKALRLVGAGGTAAHDDRRPAHPASAPLSELPASANLNQLGSSPVPPVGFTAGDFPQSRSTRTINGGSFGSAVSKSQADLVNMITSANGKYRDQARSPPIPSPKHANGTLPSPLMGGVRSLSYKKDTLSPTDNLSFANEQGHRSSSLERSRSRTPPMRELSITSRPAGTADEVAPRSSSLEDGDGVGSASAEGESTPLGKGTTDSLASRVQPTSPTVHHAGMHSISSSQTSGSLPLPGNIEGVPYKLISLEQAREQARQKQSEWLATSGGASTATKASQHLASGDSTHDELAMQRDPSSDGQSSMRLLKNKKSGFLMRKLKKEKGISVDYDGVSTFPASGSSKDLARSSKSPMPSFSVTGLDEESDQLKPLAGLTEKPALQIRPVSSMFSGFAADFLDASALSEGHLRETSNGSSTNSTMLLAPHSPAASSFRTPSPVHSEAGRFASSPYKPKLAEIKPIPHGTALPGPTVPGSAESNWSGQGGATGTSRLPSLDAGGSNSDTQSQFHSPANSPLTPSFHHSITTNPLMEEPTIESEPHLSPSIPEEVRQRAREIEQQIQELSNELHALRVKHVGHGTAPTFRPSSEAAETGEEDGEHRQAVGDCPYCGCGCAEQRRLQSINEAAVLKGISVLDRGRALKPSQNMGNTGKFGGYTNR